jgi:hypothetical protein
VASVARTVPWPHIRLLEGDPHRAYVRVSLSPAITRTKEFPPRRRLPSSEPSNPAGRRNDPERERAGEATDAGQVPASPARELTRRSGCTWDQAIPSRFRRKRFSVRVDAAGNRARRRGARQLQREDHLARMMRPPPCGTTGRGGAPAERGSRLTSGRAGSMATEPVTRKRGETGAHNPGRVP